MNSGKAFEADFGKSIPNNILLYRLHDPAQSFGINSNKLRFSHKNSFDYLLYYPTTRNLYALELKTVKGNSISFERCKDDKGEIHYHQISGLKNWDQYEGTICGFVIEFRKSSITIFIDISNFEKLISSINKKSISLNDIINSGLDYVVIPQRKLRTRYRYDIESFLDKTSTVNPQHQRGIV